MGGQIAFVGDRLTLSDTGGTTVACDAFRHEQDAWISRLLGSSPRLRLAAGALTLTSTDAVLPLSPL